VGDGVGVKLTDLKGLDSFFIRFNRVSPSSNIIGFLERAQYSKKKLSFKRCTLYIFYECIRKIKLNWRVNGNQNLSRSNY
jgi:hypothetical protein